MEATVVKVDGETDFVVKLSLHSSSTGGWMQLVSPHVATIT